MVEVGHIQCGQLRPEAVVGELAARQHGVFHWDQALSAGMTPRMIEWRCRTGRWIRVYRGVYRLAGSPVTWHQRLMAACLAAGRGAAASHRAAAAVWGADGFPPGPLELSVPGSGKALEGVTVHRSRRLTAADVREVDAIPVTGVPRLVIDLAGTAGAGDAEAVLDWALRERHVSIPYLRRRLDHLGSRGRGGAVLLYRLLDDREEHGVFESRKERQLAAALVAAGLPTPVRQYRLYDNGVFVARFDLALPERLIGIEFQSYRHHYGRRAWRSDVGRANAATALGWLVFAATDDDITDPDQLTCRGIATAYRERGFSSA